MIISQITHGEWKRPVIRPIPVKTEGVLQPVISLNGTWKLKKGFTEGFYKNSEDFASWEDIQVPGSASVRGRRFIGGEYIYKRIVFAPEDFRDKKIFIRFDAANGHTKVWVDGHFVMEHEDGLVAWDCDITGFVTPGQNFILTVAVDNSYVDDFNIYNRGGLVRDVKLIAVPRIHVTRLHAMTFFDEDYNNAVLKVMLGADLSGAEKAEIELKLISPSGEDVDIGNPVVNFDSICKEKDIEIHVASPIKWDAEHPRLYTLEAVIKSGGKKLEKVSRRIGFRQVEVIGNQMFVNGKEVKLRGICRSEVSPDNGMVVTREMTEQDVQLFKEANVNYIRTAHCPPSEYFLDLCDEYGIYVENELVAFISRTLKYSPKNPARAKRYLKYFSEFMERDLSHPCVVIWSLANESFYGPNFALINEYAHKEDPSRFTKFSYPMTMQEEDKPVDIWSIHYSNYYADLAKKHDNVSVGFAPGYDMPVLHDEYVHVSCYNREEQKRDPAVRNFWGESIKKFWDNIWNTKGALGGAIWAGIDVPWMQEWGIIDVWRRRKPEHWLTRKAYSPIRIEKTEYEIPANGELEIEVENRFNHTNLSETEIEWKVGKDRGIIKDFNLEPFEKGIMRIPARNWKKGDVVHLQFKDAVGFVVDEFELKISPSKPTLPVPCGTAPEISENDEEICVSGERFKIMFDKATGQVKSGEYNGNVLIKGGPCLNMQNVYLPQWECEGISTSVKGGLAVVTIKGKYGDKVSVTFDVAIDNEGLIITEYTIDKLAVDMPAAMKIRVGVDSGGLDEIGVYYILGSKVDTLSWERKGLWSTYPDDHIGRNRGTCSKSNGGKDPLFAQKPDIPWSDDMKSYSLYGKYDPGLRGTNDFRSMKHNILWAEAYTKGKEGSVRVLSDGSHSVRMEIIPDPETMVDDRNEAIRYIGNWYAIDDNRDYCGTETLSNTPGDYVEYTFTGTGICWIGPVDMISGIAEVYIDGKLMDSEIDLAVEGVEFPGASLGFDKRYGKPLFSIDGLEYGKHTIKIKVSDKKGFRTKGSYVAVDAFRVFGDKTDDRIKLIINNDYNYPRLSWGNYTKDAILVGEGYKNRIYMRLGGVDKNNG